MVGLQLMNVPQVGRRMRRPSHPFYLKTKAFGIYPFCIAPVLPGETLKNALLQSRVVTDPIKNKLIGWFNEYYLFYCKMSDLAGGEDFKNMHLDPDKDMSSYSTTTIASYYSYNDGTDKTVKWVSQCLERVVTEYFRDEGEAWNVQALTEDANIPVAKVGNSHWLDSAILSANLPSGDDVDTLDVVTPGDLDPAYRVWEMLMAQSLINMSYEDYLRSFGIKGQAVLAGAKRPELIRYMKDFQYPSNTVVPTTGAVTSAVSWATQERVDKDRFFAEPGFLFGVTVCRPKVYFSNQRGALVHWMSRAQDWLPAILRDDPWTSLKEFDDADGPLAGLTGGAGNDYWIDLRDLFVHGDQFVNTDITTGGGAQNDIELPGATLTNAAKFYPTEAMIDSLYVTAGTDYVYQDGIINFGILGTQQDVTDHSPG